MKTTAFLIATAILQLTVNFSHAANPSCQLDANDKMTIKECAEQLRRDFDVDLNSKYHQILASLESRENQNPHLRKQLIAAQRSWISFRDNDCKAVALHFPTDPRQDSRHSGCLMERTKQRLTELESWRVAMPKASPPTEKITSLERDGLVAGKPLSAWVQAYWQWQRSFIPADRPSRDGTGEKCQDGQKGPVFFLTGSSNETPVSRACNIPKDRYILIPIINALAQSNSSSNTTCDDYLKALQRANDSAVNLKVSINSQNIEALDQHKIMTNCFKLVDADSNLTGMAAGAGYWVMLNPLAPGEYDIRFSGKYASDGFSQNIRYRIRVE